MAERDAYYYYERAKQARANGNDRMAAIMENYARQIDPVYQDNMIKAGFVDPRSERPQQGGWNPDQNPQAPTRESLQNMYNQKMAVEQPAPSYGYAEPPAQAVQQPVYGNSVADFKQQEYGNPAVVYGGGLDDSDYREGGYITSGNAQNVDPRTGGNYDPNWNANTFGSNSTVQSQYDMDQARRAEYPEKTGYQFDDSYGRRLRDNYQPAPQKSAPASKRKGSEGDKPTWPSLTDIFPNW